VTGTDLAWDVAAAVGAELGERPVWDARARSMLWVDINVGQLHRLRVNQHGLPEHEPEAADSVIASAGVPVGAAAPRAAGGYVLAAADGFRLIGADGAVDGAALRPPGMPEHVRFNDGACDPAGRFWAGTYVTDGRAGTASLYRLDPDGSVTEVFDGVTESNGLAWSPDATVFYYTDSGEERSRVRAFGFDVQTGALSDERDLIRLDPADGIADGLVVDADGCLWIAMWDGGCVRRYSADGELIGLYPVPVSRPTCPGFGGPALDQLYLTTAWEGLAGERRDAEPLAGHLLRARPGVRGLAQACYGG
jgi:sugar lactone lactonase YvrE